MYYTFYQLLKHLVTPTIADWITESTTCAPMYTYTINYHTYTVIPRLTSDPANEDFFAVFRTWLTNVLVDARANIKQQTRTVGPFQELIFSACMCVSANEDFG